jgi:hypothetical protein
MPKKKQDASSGVFAQAGGNMMRTKLAEHQNKDA